MDTQQFSILFGKYEIKIWHEAKWDLGIQQRKKKHILIQFKGKGKRCLLTCQYANKYEGEKIKKPSLGGEEDIQEAAKNTITSTRVTKRARRSQRQKET